MKPDPKNVPACEIALELAEAYVKRPETLNLRLNHPDGTGASHTGEVRVTQFHLQQANLSSEATWLISAKHRFAAVAVEDDPARLRRALVSLGAEVIAWIASLEVRKD